MKLIKALSGGRRNTTQLYSVGSDLLVRKTFPRREGFDFYACERDTLLALAGSGFSPELVDFGDENKVLLYRFISGNSLNEAEGDYYRLGEVIAQLHATEISGRDAQFSFRRDLDRDLGDIVSFLREEGVEVSDEEKMAYGTVFAQGRNSLPIHGSLIPSNIISAGNQIYLIDFEMASMNSPFLDLGYLYGYLTPMQRKMLKEGYVNESDIDTLQFDVEINYGRNHLAALTLLLYQRGEEDEVLKTRSKKLHDFLTTPITGTEQETKLIRLFERLDLRR